MWDGRRTLLPEPVAPGSGIELEAIVEELRAEVDAGGRTAVRSGKWKFYPWPEGTDRRRRKEPKPQPKGPPVQLYDISADVAETTNLAEQNPQVVKRLQALADAHEEDLKNNRRPCGRVE